MHSGINCGHCNKTFTKKNKWYDKHVSSCSKKIEKSNVARNLNDLENDQHNNSSLYEENLNNIFNFSDLFFNQTETRFSPDLNSSLLDSHSWWNVINTLLDPESCLRKIF